jgi:hypothetical protein
MYTFLASILIFLLPVLDFRPNKERSVSLVQDIPFTAASVPALKICELFVYAGKRLGQYWLSRMGDGKANSTDSTVGSSFLIFDP